MAEMLSPGVFTTEIDASTIAPTVSNSIGVFAGQFEKGPVGDYMLITTVDELIEYYGLPTDSNYNDWYQAYNFLQYGNKLYISRAADNVTFTNAVAEAAVDGGVETTDIELESDVTTIGNADEYETAETAIAFSGEDAKLKFMAKNPGTWGNDIEIAIANPNAFNDEHPALAFEGVPLNDLFEYYPTGTQVGIVIRYGNEIKEVFTVDMDPSAKDQHNKSNYIETVINAQSNYVYVKDNTTIDGVPANYLYQHSSGVVDPDPNGPNDPNEPQPEEPDPEVKLFELQQITASDAEVYDWFGMSVAVDGTRLVVGAPEEDTAATDAGKVYIYDWNGTSYVEVGTLAASDAQAADRFGASVALDGTRLAVGAYLEDTAGYDAGKVYIYDWNSTTSTYDEVATVTASDADSEDYFGYSVALDGTRLAVGAYQEDTAGFWAGKVYIYEWNGTSYAEVTTLTASDAEPDDRFGYSVALEGSRLVVGATFEATAAGFGSGKVYIYEWNGTSYDEVATLTASDAEEEDWFGSAVALSGTRLVVGAAQEGTAAYYAGKVYIYEWNGTSYAEVTTLTASDAADDDKFGTSVSLDGTRLVVGAHYETTAGDQAGKVYIYDLDGNIDDPNDPQPEDPDPNDPQPEDPDPNEPTPDEPFAPLQLTASDAEPGDLFGMSVAVDGTRLVVSAINEDTAASQAGKVYIYDWNGTSYVEVGTLTASDAEAGDMFGMSVAVDGTRLIVGAAGESTVAEGGGKVYIYDWNGTSYDEVMTLTASDAEAGGGFGASVALDGTRLVVGASQQGIAVSVDKVYIYDWNGTSYDEVGTLTASDAVAEDKFGRSVALDGTRLVVGAFAADTAGTMAGKVYIYEWNGTSYTEVGTLTASDAEAGDMFGMSVAVDGTRLVVGAHFEDTAGTDAGKVYVYEWNGTTYDEVATVTASDAEAEDFFGVSVALDGTRLVVGAVGAGAGKVYVYYFDGTIYDPDPNDPQPEDPDPNEPTPDEPFAPLQITASDAKVDDEFGASVALDGTRLVVGAYQEGTAAEYGGKVYVYEWNGTSYVEVTTVTASDAYDYGYYGSAAALDGTRLVVGALYSSTNMGKVYIYDWNGTTYDEVGTLTASDAEAHAQFGTSVALDGTRLAVGAHAKDTAGDRAGKVYIYDWNGASYTEVAAFTASDAQAYDYFGMSVALDGARLIVGAPGETYETGKVYIYEWNGTSYDEVGTLTASDAQSGDSFGTSVALDGTRLMVGATHEDTAGKNSGKVYIYEWNGTNYVEVGTLTASDAQASDWFGKSVALDGTRLVVGATGEDDAAADAGKVYVYYFDGDIYDPAI